MPDSKDWTKLTLKTLNCSKTELAHRLGVSGGQISKWAIHGDYMSEDIKSKLRELCQIGDLPPNLVLQAKSLENAKKWAEFFEILAETAIEDQGAGYHCGFLEDFDYLAIVLTISVLDELGVELPENLPENLKFSVPLCEVEDLRDFFQNSHVKLIYEIYVGYVDLRQFFCAYIEDLLEAEGIRDEDFEIEVHLLNLAACKVETEPQIAPNFKAHKFTWVNWYTERITKLKNLAVQVGVPLKEELMDLVTKKPGLLSAAGERELLGLNKDQMHPDIYMNELLEGMREIRRDLQAIKEVFTNLTDGQGGEINNP